MKGGLHLRLQIYEEINQKNTHAFYMSLTKNVVPHMRFASLMENLDFRLVKWGGIACFLQVLNPKSYKIKCVVQFIR